MTGPVLIRSDWDATIWIEGAGDCERRLEVTPAIAGWAALSFRSYTFRAGQVIDGESATDEMAMVLLSGEVTIEIAGPGGGGRQTWKCRGRADVFAGPPYAIYLPPGHTYRTTVLRDADCAYARAPAAGSRPPRLVRPEDPISRVDGAGNRVTRIFDPAHTEHLRCRETVIAPGAWAPPPPDDASGEAVAYFRAEPEDGWGMQRLIDRDRDVALTVRHGDAVIVRGGECPVVASPGTRLYALNYAVGTEADRAARP